MNIEKKIEEIRQKPEHIRMRYVIGAVVISMFFIIVIWLFTIQQNFQSLRQSTVPTEVKDFQKELQGSINSMPSLNDAIEQNTPQENTQNTPQDAQQQNVDPKTESAGDVSSVEPTTEDTRSVNSAFPVNNK